MNKEQKVFEKLKTKLLNTPLEKWNVISWNKLGSQITYKHYFDYENKTGVIATYRGDYNSMPILPLQEIECYENNELVHSFKFNEEDSPAKELFDYLYKKYEITKEGFEKKKLERIKREEKRENAKTNRKLRKLENLL